MTKSIRVPWYTWKRFRVRGFVRERESGQPLAGYRVAAFDQDVVQDDFLGDTETDSEGYFEIRFLETDFKDMLEVRPDLYLHIFAPGSTQPLVDTSNEVRNDASDDELFVVRVPRSALPTEVANPHRPGR